MGEEEEEDKRLGLGVGSGEGGDGGSWSGVQWVTPQKLDICGINCCLSNLDTPKFKYS